MTDVFACEQATFGPHGLSGPQGATQKQVEFPAGRNVQMIIGAIEERDFAMKITRRNAMLATAATVGLSQSSWPGSRICSRFGPQIVHSITPVGFDGVWIWEDQPEDQEGMVDSRKFDVSIGIRWKTDGTVRDVMSSTVAPVAFPEQQIVSFEIQKSDGCDATVVPLSETAGQFQVFAPIMERGQEIEAKAVYRLRISRVCPHFDESRFPAEQTVSEAIRKEFLGNSPGIRSDLTSVQKIVDSLVSRHEHPWRSARKFHSWVWENIEGKPGKYTSVREAMSSRVGDCEERAGVFIALCRAAGIPARLVWVPITVGPNSVSSMDKAKRTGLPHTRRPTTGSGGPEYTNWSCKKGIAYESLEKRASCD